MPEASPEQDFGLANGLARFQMPSLDAVRIAEPAVRANIDAMARQVERGVEQHPPAARGRIGEILARQLGGLLGDVLQRTVTVEPSDGPSDRFVVVRRVGYRNTRAARRPRAPPGQLVGGRIQRVDQQAVLPRQLPCPRVETFVTPSLEPVGQGRPLFGRSLFRSGQDPSRPGNQPQTLGGLFVAGADPIGQSFQGRLQIGGHGAGVFPRQSARFSTAKRAFLCGKAGVSLRQTKTSYRTSWDEGRAGCGCVRWVGGIRSVVSAACVAAGESKCTQVPPRTTHRERHAR